MRQSVHTACQSTAENQDQFAYDWKNSAYDFYQRGPSRRLNRMKITTFAFDKESSRSSYQVNSLVFFFHTYAFREHLVGSGRDSIIFQPRSSTRGRCATLPPSICLRLALIILSTTSHNGSRPLCLLGFVLMRDGMCCTYGILPISHSCEVWGTPTARLVRTPTCPKCACAPAALAGSQNRPNKIKQAEPVVGLGSIMLTFKLRNRKITTGISDVQD